MPQVTVILPTWNRAKWLKTSIESVLSQTFQDFELIVVDDASTDFTGKILESYSGKIRTILLPKNLGVRSEEHTSELQSLVNLVCRLLLEKKKNIQKTKKKQYLHHPSDVY